MNSPSAKDNLLFDTHAHADAFPLVEWRRVAETAWQKGVRGNLNAGVWWDQLRNLLANFSAWTVPLAKDAESFDDLLFHSSHYLILPCLGLHPMEVALRWHDETGKFDLGRARMDVENFKSEATSLRQWIWAVGETGFDCAKEVMAGWSSKEELLLAQQFAFDACIEVALELKRPIVVHSRSAWQRSMQAIEVALSQGLAGFMIHCYGGPAGDLQWVARHGGFASFGGVPTWSASKKAKESLRSCPDSVLLLETDSPDLPPELTCGGRPEWNEPQYLADILEFSGILRHQPQEKLSKSNYLNFRRFLFGKN
ncbi:MAG: TatD family hydrolase [Silvanigrellaceae bacterium]